MLNSGRRGRRAPDGYGIISVNEKFNQTNYPIPIINSWAVTDGSYNPTDDLALNTAGGQTVVIYGSGFNAGATVNINGSNIGVVTVLDSGRITFTSPALSSATYTIYVSNTDGATAIYVPGLVYSGLPTWSAPAAGSIGTSYETKNVTTLSYNSFTATGDAPITYSVLSGNLPSGVTLSSSGTLSGTLPVTSSPTTYSFTIRASDAQLQDSDRSFSLTINPDVVTWVAPTLNGTLTVYETQQFSTPLSATSAAGYGVMYASNTLPTGITMTSSTGAFSGYANTVGNTFATVTATANTTGRYANSNVTFVVNQDVVTWSSPANNTNYSLSQNQAISNVTLSANSAAGYGIQYVANALPTGVTLSGGTISGTPTGLGTTYTQLTATANTTGRYAYAYISWTVNILADQYFANTVMLLSANSSYQTPSFVADNSNNNTQITVVGDTRAANFNPYQDGYYSYQLNGSTDYLSFYGLRMDTSPYTLECWFYCTGTFGSTYAILGTPNNNAFNIRINNSTTIAIDQLNVAQTTFTVPTMSPNTWYHLAVVRDRANVCTVFLNGVRSSTGTATMATNYNAVTTNIGYLNATNPFYFPGYISNLRVVKSAVYDPNQSTITVPTLPLQTITNTVLLTGHANAFVDQGPSCNTLTAIGSTKISSANPFTTQYTSNVTPVSANGYSWYVPTSQYFTANNKTKTVPSTTKGYTIEFWIHPIVANTQSWGSDVVNYVVGYPADANQPVWGVGVKGTSNYGVLELYNVASYGNAYVDAAVFGYTVTPNQWNHCVAQRRDDGVTFDLWVNGIGTFGQSMGANMVTNPSINSLNFNIGNYQQFFGGTPFLLHGLYYANTQMYAANNFSVPTTPKTANTYMTLLMAQTANTIYNANTNPLNDWVTTNGTKIQPVSIHPWTYDTSLPTSYSSIQFNGSTDYFTIPSNAGFQFGTGDFTVECWIYKSAAGNSPIIDARGAATAVPWAFYVDASNYPYFYDGTVETSTVAIVNNQWNHVAAVRTSGTLKIFVNGVQGYSSAMTTALNPAATVYIGGQNFSTSAYTAGYISNLRVIKGQALYTGNFTPATNTLTATTVGTSGANVAASITGTVPFLAFNTPISSNTNAANNMLALTAISAPALTSYSPFTSLTTGYGYSNTAISTTLGSGYFDGTGDYLTASAGQNLAFGTGDFTIECWIYPTVQNQNCNFIDMRPASTNGFYPNISLSATSNAPLFFVNNATVITGSALSNINTWYHLALVRSGGSTKMYINGTQTGSTYTDTNNYLSGSPVVIGAGSFTLGGAPYSGYISDLRITKGTAVYTSNFVPQFGAPMTAVANTQLLTIQTNGVHNNSTFKDQSYFSSNNVITRSGNTTNGLFSPYGDNFSNYFNGSSYLNVGTNAAFAIGTADFTIEAWVYPTTTEGFYSCIFGGMQFGSSSDWNLLCGTNLYPVFQFTNSTSDRMTSTIPMTQNAWNHVALSRQSGTARFFINGQAAGSGPWATQSLTNALSKGIGGSADGSGSTTFTGYISNLRIVSGTSLYNAVFNPSTSPLTAIPGTILLTCQSNRFVDNSPNNISPSVGGSPLVQKFSPFSTTVAPKYYSTLFNGSSDYLTAPSKTNYATAGDFTFETWMYSFNTTSANQNIINIGTYTSGLLFRIIYASPSGRLEMYILGSQVYIGASTVINTNTWYHVAVVRSSNVINIYLNGTSIASFNNSSSIPANDITIGRAPHNSSEYFNGYMSNYRYVVGQALYTGTFTPATSPLTTTSVGTTGPNVAANLTGTVALLTLRDNNFIDNSTNNNQLTAGSTTVKPLPVSPFISANANTGLAYSTTTFGGSMYFDGVGDQLTLGGGITLDNTNFTVEGWFYQTGDWGSGSYCVPMSGGTSGSSQFLMDYDIGTSGTNRGTVGLYNGGTTICSANTAIKRNQWNHIAWVRSNGYISIYVNGISVAGPTLNTTATGVTWLGGFMGSSGYEFKGYISDYRITKGQALYTSNFVPGPTPLTPIAYINNRTDLANTTQSALLLSGTSGGVIDQTRSLDLETVGDAKVTPFGPYNGSYYSNYFNGSTDYLGIPDNASLEWGSSTFTLEMWINTTATNQYTTIMSREPLAYQTGEWALQVNQSGASSGNVGLFVWDYNSGGASPLLSSTGVNVCNGAWHHIAVVRNVNAWTLYVDGISVATNTWSGSVVDIAYGNVIGRSDNYGRYFNGYISNVRFVKGTAIVPPVGGPTSPLTAVSGTNLLTCQSNKFVDNSTNAYTITPNGVPKVATQNPFQVNSGQSYYFDGTGDYLYSPSNVQTQVGTGDYTIEYWVNPTNFTAQGTHINLGYLQIYTTTGGVVTVYGGSAGTTLLITGTTIVAGAWTHISLTRQSGVGTTLWINGTKVGSVAVDSTSYAASAMYIGATSSATNLLVGYMTDVRITRSIARYTSNNTTYLVTGPYMNK